MIIGKERATEILENTVRLAQTKGADSAFVLLRNVSQKLTRYSNNAIENSTDSVEPQLYIRVSTGNKMAEASCSRLDDEACTWLAEMCVSNALASHPAKRVPLLSRPPCVVREIKSYDEATAGMSAEERAHLIIRAVKRVGQRSDVRLYGNAVTGFEERAIANSNGVSLYFIGSTARLQVTALADTRGAGLARHLGRSMQAAAPELLADDALFKAAHFGEFKDVDPGEYEVVLLPDAGAELLHHLGYLGFSGSGHLNGSSCFASQIGEMVLSPEVSICDDPLRPEHMCEPFDYEGTPKSTLKLVEKGVVRGAVYDLETAQKAGTASTGHALPPEGYWFSEGPYASHLVLEPGNSTREELVSGVERGLLITAFHYTRPLDQKRAILTGMTRNGTFLIEKGKIAAMLPNLRFTVSAVTLLKNVISVGNDLTLAGDYMYNMSPSLRTTRFSVTGKTSG